MTREEVDNILKNRKLGEKIDMRWSDLEGADLEGADLQTVDLASTNFKNANLKNADLRSADLRWTDLRGADLRGADLKSANLKNANLQNADVKGAILDFSALPLSCGSFDVKADDRLVYQLLFHVRKLNIDGCSEPLKVQLKAIIANNPSLFNGFRKYRTDL